tara:strand:- start:130 stop:315 length:186 start_codon:yes stop_codon:yes gene_type:complete
MINHLKDVKESYFVHFWFCIRLIIGFLFLAFVSLIHAIFPFVLINTVSNQIEILNKRLKER